MRFTTTCPTVSGRFFSSLWFGFAHGTFSHQSFVVWGTCRRRKGVPEHDALHFLLYRKSKQRPPVHLSPNPRHAQEKQAENIVEKLCQRFRLSEDPRQWRDIAFCLALLPFKSERSVKKLIEGLQFYRDKLHEEVVFGHFAEILSKARSNKSANKPDTELNEFESVGAVVLWAAFLFSCGGGSLRYSMNIGVRVRKTKRLRGASRGKRRLPRRRRRGGVSACPWPCAIDSRHSQRRAKRHKRPSPKPNARVQLRPNGPNDVRKRATMTTTMTCTCKGDDVCPGICSM